MNKKRLVLILGFSSVVLLFFIPDLVVEVHVQRILRDRDLFFEYCDSPAGPLKARALERYVQTEAGRQELTFWALGCFFECDVLESHEMEIASLRERIHQEIEDVGDWALDVQIVRGWRTGGKRMRQVRRLGSETTGVSRLQMKNARLREARERILDLYEPVEFPVRVDHEGLVEFHLKEIDDESLPAWAIQFFESGELERSLVLFVGRDPSS